MNDDTPVPIDFVVNLKEVYKSNNIMSAIRLFAVKLIEDEGYGTVKDFLTSLTDRELQEFMLRLDNRNEQKDPDLEYNLVLLTMMLCNSEGVRSKDTADLSEKILTTISFLTLESLKRKGMVDVFYENMSLDPDFGHLQIAKIRPQFL